ncbi:hypothetical protein [Methanothermococcus okinawensis]|nr:hypothetical protein [Methanothermococcus okinawensis]
MLCMVGAVFATSTAVSGTSTISGEKIGAYTQKLYDEGKITKNEYDRLMGKLQYMALAGTTISIFTAPSIVSGIGAIVFAAGVSSSVSAVVLMS